MASVRATLLAVVGVLLALSGASVHAADVPGAPVVVGAERADRQGPSVIGPRRTETTALSEGEWRFNASLYAWFTFINGSVTLFDDTQDVAVDLDDIWKRLHVAFMADGDVQYERVGFFADVFYMRKWDRNRGVLFDSKTDTNTVLLDFGLFWEALNEKYFIGEQATRWRIQPYVAGRYLYMGIDARLNNHVGAPRPSIDVDGASHTAAPVLGLRGFIDIGERWNLSLSGDGGGFGVDGLDKTWLAELYGGYRFPFEHADLNLMLGYKAVGIESSGDQIDTDLVFHGPVVRLQVEF